MLEVRIRRAIKRDRMRHEELLRWCWSPIVEGDLVVFQVEGKERSYERSVGYHGRNAADTAPDLVIRNRPARDWKARLFSGSKMTYAVTRSPSQTSISRVSGVPWELMVVNLPIVL